MDDDEEEREFSKSIVYGFFEQADATFMKMDTALWVCTSYARPFLLRSAIIKPDLIFHRQKKDLVSLSSLGHFLKGSSATLGLTKVNDSCEKIQHYGDHKDEHGNSSSKDDASLLSLIRSTLEVVKVDYGEAERVLKRFYHDSET